MSYGKRYERPLQKEGKMCNTQEGLAMFEEDNDIQQQIHQSLVKTRSKIKLHYSEAPLLVVCKDCIHLVLDLMDDPSDDPKYICITGMDRLDVFWRRSCPNQLIIENKK